MGFKHLVIFLSIFVCFSQCQNPVERSANANKLNDHSNVSTIVEHYGYPIELHSVTTQDGYILLLHRIPSSPKCKANNNNNKTVVFLQHGLVCDSSSWIMNPPDESLPFLLADQCFDVWMGNSRGNTYSQKHVKLNPKKAEFWKFSWDEMALFDTPAKLNFILNITGSEQISYIGHSEGTEMVFAFFGNSSNPQAQKLYPRIKHLVALAPVGNISHVELGFFQKISQLPSDLLFLLFGEKSVLESDAWYDEAIPILCDISEKFCTNAICFIGGCESSQDYNKTATPFLFGHFPSGTSVQNLAHYAQSVKDKKFQRYDFGPIENEKRYGTQHPPVWRLDGLARLKSIHFFSGGNDKLADPTDVQQLVRDLVSDGVRLSTQQIPSYGHPDFLWAVDAPSKLYDSVIQILKN